MVERINLLLRAKNITARQFAEEIGIQPSGMSHILSGRNNPSLDFVMKVIRRWPEVNINWLMFGTGEMYASVPISVSSTSPSIPVTESVLEPESSNYDLFSQPVDPEVAVEAVGSVGVGSDYPNTNDSGFPVVDNFQSENVKDVEPVSPEKPLDSPNPQLAENRVYDSEQANDTVQPILVNESKSSNQGKKIKKIVILYDDHSFSEYYPE